MDVKVPRKPRKETFAPLPRDDSPSDVDLLERPPPVDVSPPKAKSSNRFARIALLERTQLFESPPTIEMADDIAKFKSATAGIPLPPLATLEYFLAATMALRFMRIRPADFLEYIPRARLKIPIDRHRLVSLLPDPPEIVKFGQLRMSVQVYFDIDLKCAIRELRRLIEHLHARLVELDVLLDEANETTPPQASRSESAVTLTPPDQGGPGDGDGVGRRRVKEWRRPVPSRGANYADSGTDSWTRETDPRNRYTPDSRVAEAQTSDPQRSTRPLHDAERRGTATRSTQWARGTPPRKDGTRLEAPCPTGVRTRRPSGDPPAPPASLPPRQPDASVREKRRRFSLELKAGVPAEQLTSGPEMTTCTGVKRAGGKLQKSYRGLGVKSSWWDADQNVFVSTFELDVDDASSEEGDSESVACMAEDSRRTVMSTKKILFDPAVYGSQEMAKAAAEAFEFKIDKCTQSQGSSSILRPPKRLRRGSRDLQTSGPVWRREVVWNPFGHCMSCSCTEDGKKTQVHCRTCLCETPNKIPHPTRRSTIRNGPDIFSSILQSENPHSSWTRCFERLLSIPK